MKQFDVSIVNPSCRITDGNRQIDKAKAGGRSVSMHAACRRTIPHGGGIRSYLNRRFGEISIRSTARSQPEALAKQTLTRRIIRQSRQNPHGQSLRGSYSKMSVFISPSGCLRPDGHGVLAQRTVLTALQHFPSSSPTLYMEKSVRTSRQTAIWNVLLGHGWI